MPLSQAPRVGRASGVLRSAVIALAVVTVGGFAIGQSSAQEARAIPRPDADSPPGPGLKTAVLAGGCFWGVQAVYQHVEGVTSAVSGYAGGDRSTASYQRVGAGDTGHAEAVRVTYDPNKISYGRILQVYFSVAHDPTTLNRQGPDRGPQYRSAIFPGDEGQARVAKAYIAQLDKANAFDRDVVTRIEPGKSFYPAEAYHQDFLARHPTHPYIVVNDLPKIAALKRILPDLYRADPVLVASGPSD